MKNWIILFAVYFLRLTFSYSQGNNDAMKMPPFNADILNNYYYQYYPPVSLIISTTNNGSVIINNSGNRSGTSVFSDHSDIHVYPDNEPQTEPHLIINKNHPNNVIISANLTYAITSTGFKHDQSIYTNYNYNLTPWVGLKYFPPTGTKARGDPSTAADANGKLFVSTVSENADDFDFNKSSDLGVSWLPNFISGGATTSVGDFDKEMIAIDNLPYSPYVDNVYCAWTDFGSPNNSIFFSRLIPGSSSFSSPDGLNQQCGQGTNVQTGPNGEVYVCWADYGAFCPPPHAAQYIGFSYSLTGGAPGSFTTTYPITYRGIRTNWGGAGLFNDTKINDFPAMAVDRTCGPSSSSRRGRIYITYAEYDAINTQQSRVVVQFSNNNGISWAKGNSTNNSNGIVDVNGNQNWQPWIAVDDATGNVYVAYLSAINSPSNGVFWTDVYLAFSEDGGYTFNNIKVSDFQINPTQLGTLQNFQGYWGDYIAVDAYGGKAYVAWMSNHGMPFYNQYNIFCSTVTSSTPVEFSSQLDMAINGPVIWSSPPGDPSTVLYEAVNSITAAVNGDQFNILSGADVTFKAGNSIHFKPGLTTVQDFGSLLGSKTHAYIAPMDPCTTPFRIRDVNSVDAKNNEGEKNNLSVYPNPFYNYFDVNYSLFTDEKVTIQLLDAFGKIVLKIVNDEFLKSGEYTVKVNFPVIKNGIYFLNMISEENIFTKKIIKL